MKNDLSFLGRIEQDDKVLASTVLSWAEITQEKYINKFTFFLDEHKAALCRKVLASVCFENYRLYGGYENASRCILGMFMPYDDPDNAAFPMKAFTFRFREVDKLTHRDFLGCLMSLGIKRETVGDIIVGQGYAGLYVYDTVASLVSGIEKVGRVGVKVFDGFDSSLLPVQQFSEINGTVASLRLDSVLSLALRISREKASALIKSSGVELNYVSVYSSDVKVSVGDVFSARGYGKFILSDLGSISKKDRIHIVVKKYL